MENKTKIVEVKKNILKEFYYQNKLSDLLIKVIIVLCSFLEISIAWFIQQAINSISLQNSFEKLVKIVICSVAVLVFIILLNYILQRLQNSYKRRFSVFLKEKMFSDLLKKKIVDFEKHDSGEYLSVFQIDLQKVSVYYITGIWIIVKSFATCIFGVSSMVLMSPEISALIIIVQIFPVSITLILGRKLRTIEQKAVETRGRFNSYLQDYLKGFRLIKMFSAENTFKQSFSKYNFDVDNYEKKFNDANIYISLINTFANFLVIIAIFLVGGIETIKGTMKIGTVIACFELLNMISSPLSTITGQINLVRTSNAIFERIYYLFCFESDEHYHKTETLNEIENISFENVSFGYEEDYKTISGITFTFEKGKKYAIVGYSGSGKTTLIKLLMGYFDEYEGNILFNNKEQRHIKTPELNREVSLVQQNVFIFNNTVLYNITLNLEFSQNEIEQSIMESGLKEFIESKGYHYICGEGGKNISGGEMQRISLSRSLLKKSSVIIFDEATSALDSNTAYEIEKTISGLKQTCISVTHRMNKEILRMYDSIIVLNNGRICEFGTFDELNVYGTVFKKLYAESSEV